MKLRDDAKFHDGEPFDAEAAKANLDRARTLPDSPAQDRARLGRQRRGRRSDDARHQAEAPGRDAARPAHRPRRHDAVAQEPSPAMSAPSRSAPAPTSSSSACRTTASCWRSFKELLGRRRTTISTASSTAPIPDTTVRLANLRAGELDMLERLAPTDVKSAQGRQEPEGREHRRARLSGHHHQHRQWRGRQQRRWARTSGCARRSRSRSTARCSTRSCSRGSTRRCIQPFPPASPYVSAKFPVPRARRRQGQGAAEGGRPRARSSFELSSSPTIRSTQQLGQVIQAMAPEAGIDVQIRSTEFASQLRDQQQGKFPDRAASAGPAASTRTATSTSSSPARATRTTASTATPRSTSCSNEARTRLRPRRAQEALRRGPGDPPGRAADHLLSTTRPCSSRCARKVQGFVLNPDGMIRLTGMKRLRMPASPQRACVPAREGCRMPAASLALARRTGSAVGRWAVPGAHARADLPPRPDRAADAVPGVAVRLRPAASCCRAIRSSSSPARSATRR